MVAVKQEIRDKELWDADIKGEDEKIVNSAIESKIEKDAFFESDSSSDDEVNEKMVVEKRPVMRDGRVPKLKKNFEKMQ